MKSQPAKGPMPSRDVKPLKRRLPNTAPLKGKKPGPQIVPRRKIPTRPASRRKYA